MIAQEDWKFIRAAHGLAKKCLVLDCDNVLWGGKVADESVQDDQTQAIRSFNEVLQADLRVSLCLVPLGDGVTLAQKLA